MHEITSVKKLKKNRRRKLCNLGVIAREKRVEFVAEDLHLISSVFLH